MIKLPEPLKLDEIKNYVKPICLQEPGVKINAKNCYVAGWGRVYAEEGGLGQKILLSTRVPFVKLPECKKTFPYVTEKEVCAGSSTHSACAGDSGGPLQCTNKKDGSWTMVGIASQGRDCKLTTYTRILYYLEWINNIRKNNP